MQTLLSWSINHTDSEKLKSHSPSSELNTEIIDYILDYNSTVLNRLICTGYDPNECLETRLEALSELDDQLADIDAANRSLNLWPSLIKGLTEEGDMKIKELTLQIIGTALQNNQKAQQYFDHIKGMEALLGILKSGQIGLLNKLFYALNAAVFNYNDSFIKFANMGGICSLYHVLSHPSIYLSDKRIVFRILHFIQRSCEQNSQNIPYWTNNNEDFVPILESLGFILKEDKDLSILNEYKHNILMLFNSENIHHPSSHTIINK